MKKLIIGNWKSNKSTQEALDWLSAFAKSTWDTEAKRVVLCPPFTHLATLKQEITRLQMPLALGTQDVSPFGIGAYTGAIAVEQVEAFISYGIVGHSERRKHFHESDEEVLKKVKRLLEQKITPVLCISDLEQLEFYLQQDNTLQEYALEIVFVYEPPSAISGGGAYRPESPEVANDNAAQIAQKIGKEITVLYGGSLNPENVASFFSKDHIHGGLVGQASLDAMIFSQLIANA